MTTALQKIVEQTKENNGKLPTITPSDLKQWEPKRLSQKHKTIIALHVQGVPRIDIASIAGCTPEYVSMVVKTKLAQEYLSNLEAYMDESLRIASVRAVETIHETLDSNDEEIKLKAARLALEATGKLKEKKDAARSAEDVVANILANAKTIVIAKNAQINQGD